MSTSRVVKKIPIAMEDLALGIGTTQQSRGSNVYTVHRIDAHVATTTTAEVEALDVTKYTRARVYLTTTKFVDYIYDPDATAGLASTGTGKWVLSSNGTSIVRASTDGFPDVGLYNEGTELKFWDTLDAYTLLRSETGELQWVEEGNVGDEVDVTAASHLTLAQAQASDLKVGQYVRLTDYGNALYQIVDVGDAGGFYLPLSGSVKLKIVISNGKYHSTAFGAKHDGVTDDSTAINAMVALSKTHVAPHVIVDGGSIALSAGVTFDLPDYSVLDVIGTFTTTIDDDVVVRLGSSARNSFGITFNSIKVKRVGYDTTGTSVGVQIRNLVNCAVDIRQSNGFRDGVFIYADQPNGGCSHNEIRFGDLQNNRRTVYLYTDGVNGYCNENNMHGGNCNHTTDYPDVTTVHYEIGYNNYRNNNNRWYYPSFEDNNAVNAKCAIINGDNNYIYQPRLEHPNNQYGYEIEFTTFSSECGIIGRGFGLNKSNITDNGANNEWDTRQGVRFSRQVLDQIGEGVVVGQSTATDLAKIFLAQSISGVDKAYLRGDGFIYSALKGYFEAGIRMSTSSGSLDDFGIYVTSGSPEGVIAADAGSICLSKNGSLYKKSAGSGGGNTGWVAIA